MQRILITGISGGIGQVLAWHLKNEGFEVRGISRSNKNRGPFPVYNWDLNKGYLEEDALIWAEVIIHLSGANIAEKPWTKKRKKELIDSRVKGLKLIYKSLKKEKHNVQYLISASGINYYSSSLELATETSPPGSNFVSQICEKWEAASEPFIDLGISRAILRLGIVLQKEKGFLKEIGRGSFGPLVGLIGSKREKHPWLHEDDLMRLFSFFLEQKREGIYNVFSKHTSIAQFQKLKARIRWKRVFSIPIPNFALNLVLGKRSILLTKGLNCSNQKLLKTGFSFDIVSPEEGVRRSGKSATNLAAEV